MNLRDDNKTLAGRRIVGLWVGMICVSWLAVIGAATVAKAAWRWIA